MDGGAGDEGTLILVAIPHLDPECDLSGSGRVDVQGAFGSVAHSKLPGAFEQDAVPAEIADDGCYQFLFLLHLERKVLPARVSNFMPLLFSIVDLHVLIYNNYMHYDRACQQFRNEVCIKM